MSINSAAFTYCMFIGMLHAATDRAASIGELIQRGRLAEARAELSGALQEDASNAPLWNLLGVVNAQEGKRAAAEDAFRKAVRLAPRLESAWLNLGRLYTIDGADKLAFDKAVSAYNEALRLDPDNPEAHHQLALLLEWKGQFRESLEHLDRLPPQDRERRAALALRCADSAAMGNTKAAIEIADRLLKDPQLEERDIMAILPPIAAHNQNVALHLLRGLDTRGLGTPRVWEQLAKADEARSDFTAARETYERVAQASPHAAPPLLDLARIAWKQKNYEDALGYLAHARDLEPANARIHFAFGITCNEMHLPIEAKKALTKALELAPENPYYNYAMGAVLLQWAEKDQAVPYFKKFSSLKPGDARGHLALATAYFSMLQYEKAKTELQMPLKNRDTRSGAEYLLGRIAVEQEDFDGAIGHFRQLLALTPESAEGHAELSSAFLEKKDVENARREASLALALDPDNYLANRMLLRIYHLRDDPRAKEQAAKLEKLISKREERSKLLQRTIEVRPW